MNEVSPVALRGRHSGGSLAYFAVAYGTTAALQKGCGFAVFLWLAHSLSAQDYATFGLLFALQTALATLAVAGIVEAVMGLLKECNSRAQRLHLFATANTVFTILSAPAVVVAVVVYDVLMRDGRVAVNGPAFAIAGGLLAAFISLQASVVRLEERHRVAIALGFFPPLLGFVGGAVAVFNGYGVTSYYVGSTLGLLLALLVAVALRVGTYAFTARRTDLTQFLTRIAPFILVALVGWCGGYGNTYVVKALFTSTDVAKFTFAYTLSSVMQLVATSLNQVWSPRFLRLIHELPATQVEARNRRFFALQGVALGVTGAGLLLIVPLVISKVGGNLAAYSGMNLEMLLLFAAYAFAIPWYHLQSYYYAHGMGKALMSATVLGSVCGIVLALVAMWAWGTIGVYVGFMVQFITRSLGTVLWARKEWAVRIAWEGIAAAVVLLGGAAVVVATLS
jgi:O-antigen/teichoic acid export membrane protein